MKNARPHPGPLPQGENFPKPDSRLEPLNRQGEKPKDLGRTKMFFPSFPHLCPSQIFGWVHGEGESLADSRRFESLPNPFVPQSEPPTERRLQENVRASRDARRLFPLP